MNRSKRPESVLRGVATGLVAKGLEPQELRDDGAPGLALAHDASRTVPGDMSGLRRGGIPAVGVCGSAGVLRAGPPNI
jgi:hypothetical protein